MTTPIDWSIHDKYPEYTCECRCGQVYRSHSRYSLERNALISRIPCPGCKKDGDLRRASSDPEYQSIGGK